MPNWHLVQKSKVELLLILPKALQVFKIVLRVCGAEWPSLWWIKVTSTRDIKTDMAIWLHDLFGWQNEDLDKADLNILEANIVANIDIGLSEVCWPQNTEESTLEIWEEG